jgi:hypothetical protein
MTLKVQREETLYRTCDEFFISGVLFCGMMLDGTTKNCYNLQYVILFYEQVFPGNNKGLNIKQNYQT